MKLAIALFGLASAVAYLVGLPYWEWQLECAVKPLPILALGALLWLSGRRDVFAAAVMVGLALSGVADVVLHIPGDGTFVPGLVLFLTAHLAYVVAFLSESRARRLLAALPVAVFGAGIFAALAPGLGPFKIPVLAYDFVICTMLWRALALLRPGARHAVWASLGALSFVLSDSILAFYKFHTQWPWAIPVLMVLYWLGQLGITAAAAWRTRGATRGAS